MRRRILLLLTLCSLLPALTGCTPVTYPKESFKESIIKICKNEYKTDVKVEAVEGTVAIYLPLEDLIDFTFSITKAASEKINNVILSVTRVALSTNAKFNFYCIIAHDTKIPEIQIVIIKSVADVKRFLLSDISRGEYSQRMLIDLRLSPQAQKERVIKDIMSKMSLDTRTQEQVMGDFFRSEPTVLSDMGYWNGRFYIKDVTLGEFLAEQLANRIRMKFKEDKELSKNMPLKTAKGEYISKGGVSFFKFELSPEYKLYDQAGGKKIFDRGFEASLRLISAVLRGYRFEDFNNVVVINQLNGKVAEVSREDLEKFRVKKLKLEDILN